MSVTALSTFLPLVYFFDLLEDDALDLVASLSVSLVAFLGEALLVGGAFCLLFSVAVTALFALVAVVVCLVFVVCPVTLACVGCLVGIAFVVCLVCLACIVVFVAVVDFVAFGVCFENVVCRALVVCCVTLAGIFLFRSSVATLSPSILPADC